MGAISSPGGGGIVPANIPWFDVDQPDVLTIPSASQFTVLQNANMGGLGSVTDLVQRGVAVNAVSHTTPIFENVICAEVTASAGFTLTAFLHANGPWTPNNWSCGLHVRDSNNRIIQFGFENISAASASACTVYNTWTSINDTAPGELFTGTEYFDISNLPHWHRVATIGSDFVHSIALDGENFQVVRTIATNNFLTGSIAAVGIMVDNQGQTADQNCFVNCYSFLVS